MIVEPDFPDHWKVKLLVSLTGQKHAPIAVIRLWAHCQQRKAWVFPAYTDQILASITCWDCDLVSAWDALLQAGWIDLLPGGGFEVHQWSEVNAKLLANWTNGIRGGRPPKSTGNPTGTHAEPTPIPPVTAGEDRTGGDGIRGDGTDLEEKQELLSGSASPSPDESDLGLRSDRSVKKEKDERLENARLILGFLNERAGRQFRETESNLKLIAARLSEVGDDVDGVQKMIARQVLRWGVDPIMSEYLRPETIFGKSKFGSYFDTRDLPAEPYHKPGLRGTSTPSGAAF